MNRGLFGGTSFEGATSVGVLIPEFDADIEPV
jgi:hypothetical protein